MSPTVTREGSGIGVNRATENFSLVYGCVGWFYLDFLKSAPHALWEGGGVPRSVLGCTPPLP